MINVASCNIIQGNHLPYSIAVLVSFLKKHDYIVNNFKFLKTYIHRDKYNDYIDTCNNVDILLCSCYIWNWNVTLELAKEVKARNPGCLIIFGGPQVPDNDPEFFEKYDFIDIIVHGEGEHTLEEIFFKYFHKESLEGIEGTQTRIKKYTPRKRITDLDEIPSPWLTNVIWELVDDDPDLTWIYHWETTRGCPFKCTFCDWGSATATKMRQFGKERLIKEIQWFEDNNVKNLYIVDSNFGIYRERDQAIADRLSLTDFVLHITWAKIKFENLRSIANTLRDRLMDGFELALQSLTKRTLKTIKRSNVRFNDMNELTEQIVSDGHRGFVELIVGLPGESLRSWMDTLNQVIADRNVKALKKPPITIRVYMASMLPNAEMGHPEYIKQNEIRTFDYPVPMDPKIDAPREKETYICGSNTYNFDDYKQMLQYTWMIHLFHLRGITYRYAWILNDHMGVTLDQFYIEFFNYLSTGNSTLCDEYIAHERAMNYALEHKKWPADGYGSTAKSVNGADWIRDGAYKILEVDPSVGKLKSYSDIQWILFYIDLNKHFSKKFEFEIPVNKITKIAKKARMEFLSETI